MLIPGDTKVVSSILRAEVSKVEDRALDLGLAHTVLEVDAPSI